MFCPKCGSEIAEGSAFCGKCGAPVNAQAAGAAPAGSAQGAASGGAGAGAPVPKRSGAKIGAIAAVVVVAVVLVAGFATNWFGVAGVQPKEAVEIPAASQGADGQQDANAADGQGDGVGESADGAQGDSQDAGGAAVKSAVEAYTWDELSQISAEIGGVQPVHARGEARRHPGEVSDAGRRHPDHGADRRLRPRRQDLRRQGRHHVHLRGLRGAGTNERGGD